EWSDAAPPPPAGSPPLAEGEAAAQLDALLPPTAERRTAQAAFAEAAAGAFQPREDVAVPRIVAAEAGTGVGKTLGYVAPASLWAERAGAPVWISTYTRNLQRQIDGELNRLFPDPAEKARRVVTRKGRENYLCLLNYEDSAIAVGGRLRDGRDGGADPGAIAFGLVARWIGASRDGAVVAGDWPSWLGELIGPGRLRGLIDRRGECVHGACAHYHRCFVERAIRQARRADVVIGNHALVLTHAALRAAELDDDGEAGGEGPLRFVFDESHHVFDAADQAFSVRLSGREAVELRRWLLGAEGRRRSRARGLRRRLEDLLMHDAEAERLVLAAMRAAAVLPTDGWLDRCAAPDLPPDNPCEAFLACAHAQALARAPHADDPYSMDCAILPAIDGLSESAGALGDALERLRAALDALASRLAERLDDDADSLNPDQRRRLDAAARGLRRRARSELSGWTGLLSGIAAGRADARFVDWLQIERIDGRDIDIAAERRWLDPTIPFAGAVLRPAHGALFASATLLDAPPEGAEPDALWAEADRRIGVAHLDDRGARFSAPSPFAYAEKTRVFIVTDVRKDDLDQVAAAVRTLFAAAGGGAMGVFTAIARLRGVHRRIVEPMEREGWLVLAQHVDGMDAATLVNIFRREPKACLLGAEALRDGVDVPGAALRLLVSDRTPWPRPDLLHKARRDAASAAGEDRKAFDDRIARARLKQAYGRLIRRADDTGVFVLLDPMTPSRLLTAFPDGVAVARVGLAEAAAETAAFLSSD
ncbi:MAG: ATP-dependent DNA helicase, partial [Pseudomonadota bacterium]